MHTNWHGASDQLRSRDFPQQNQVAACAGLSMLEVERTNYLECPRHSFVSQRAKQHKSQHLVLHRAAINNKLRNIKKPSRNDHRARNSRLCSHTVQVELLKTKDVFRKQDRKRWLQRDNTAEINMK